MSDKRHKFCACGNRIRWESIRCTACQLMLARTSSKTRKCLTCSVEFQSINTGQKFCDLHGVGTDDYTARYTRSSYLKHKNAAYALLGEVCAVCGFFDRRALNIDHRKGGGGKEYRKNRSHDWIYRDVLKNPNKYQILCANHNWIKRIENGEVKVHEFRQSKEPSPQQ